jgi:lysophospholipase L1-like esterase
MGKNVCRLFFVSVVTFAMFLSGCSSLSEKPESTETGTDTVNVFYRALKGEPLHCVAIGGSITQAGGGWIGPWLEKTFPNSETATFNAGMSATGSMLGMFRLGRDVISCQPDLVLIEFAVNDGGTSDEDAIRALESIIIRLKKLPHPPAIVFVEAASKTGSKIARHSKVASHYGLFEINLQEKTDTHLKEQKLNWDALFTDNVHPGDKGHKFYSKAISEELEKLVARARKLKAPATEPGLPEKLSKEPLILDGKLMPLPVAEGWGQQASVPFWWDKFFTGVLAPAKAGNFLKIPCRGSIVGIFYALAKDKYGDFYVSLDGHPPKLINCGYRDGYSYTILGNNLNDGQHVVYILPLAKEVKLGYLLAGGGSNANKNLASQGKFSKPENLDLAFKPVSNWQWIGPFGKLDKHWPVNGPSKYFNEIFVPEKQLETPDFKEFYNSTDGKKLEWKKENGSELDFQKYTGLKDRGIFYASTNLDAPKAGEYALAVKADYWCKIWINGKQVLNLDHGHGHPKASPTMFTVKLQKGSNLVMVKLNSGSNGCYLSLGISGKSIQ